MSTGTLTRAVATLGNNQWTIYADWQWDSNSDGCTYTCTGIYLNSTYLTWRNGGVNWSITMAGQTWSGTSSGLGIVPGGSGYKIAGNWSKYVSRTKSSQTFTLSIWVGLNGSSIASYNAGVTASATASALGPLGSYTITFNDNGGTGGPGTYTKWHNYDLVIPSATPTKSNYKFLGWSTSPTATTATYEAGKTYSGTKDEAYTLYAVWEAQTPNPATNITIDFTNNDDITLNWSNSDDTNGVSCNNTKISYYDNESQSYVTLYEGDAIETYNVTGSAISDTQKYTYGYASFNIQSGHDGLYGEDVLTDDVYFYAFNATGAIYDDSLLNKYSKVTINHNNNKYNINITTDFSSLYNSSVDRKCKPTIDAITITAGNSIIDITSEDSYVASSTISKQGVINYTGSISDSIFSLNDFTNISMTISIESIESADGSRRTNILNNINTAGIALNPKVMIRNIVPEKTKTIEITLMDDAKTRIMNDTSKFSWDCNSYYDWITSLDVAENNCFGKVNLTLAANSSTSDTTIKLVYTPTFSNYPKGTTSLIFMVGIREISGTMVIEDCQQLATFSKSTKQRLSASVLANTTSSDLTRTYYFFVAYDGSNSDNITLDSMSYSTAEIEELISPKQTYTIKNIYVNMPDDYVPSTLINNVTLNYAWNHIMEGEKNLRAIANKETLIADNSAGIDYASQYINSYTQGIRNAFNFSLANGTFNNQFFTNKDYCRTMSYSSSSSNFPSYYVSVNKDSIDEPTVFQTSLPAIRFIYDGTEYDGCQKIYDTNGTTGLWIPWSVTFTKDIYIPSSYLGTEEIDLLSNGYEADGLVSTSLSNYYTSKSGAFSLSQYDTSLIDDSTVTTTTSYPINTYVYLISDQVGLHTSTSITSVSSSTATKLSRGCTLGLNRLANVNNIAQTRGITVDDKNLVFKKGETLVLLIRLVGRDNSEKKYAPKLTSSIWFGEGSIYAPSLVASNNTISGIDLTSGEILEQYWSRPAIKISLI